MAGDHGDYTFCEELVENLMESGETILKENHVNGLLNSLAKSWKPAKAEEVYDIYFGPNRAYENLKPNEFTFGCLINSWARVGNVERADAWLRKMMEYGVA